MPHADRLFVSCHVAQKRNRSEAEDLVKENAVQAMQSFHRFTPGTNCRAWLMSILHNLGRTGAGNWGAVLDGDVEERFEHVLAFVPPVPDRLTDEDILAALARIPRITRKSFCCATSRN